MINNLLSWPERVFLWHGAAQVPPYLFSKYGGYNWLESPHSVADIAYVRADLYTSLQEAHAKALQGEEVMRERWQQARELNVGMERKVQKMQVQIDQQAAIIRGGFHGAK